MTLTNRLLVFFLGTLALVLAGFSVTVYLLASNYLYWRADEQLETALNSVAASTFFGKQGPGKADIAWNLAERDSSFSHEAGESQLHWVVLDDQARRIDGSSDQFVDSLVGDASATSVPEMRPLSMVDADNATWLIMFRRLRSDLARTEAGPAADSQPNPLPQQVVLGAGLNLEEQYGLLRGLAGLLVLLSAGMWLAALICGRRICRRALAPVIAMAQATDEIRADALSQRLPESTTKDELGDLSRAFNELLDRLQESFERQQRFTTDASHQLRSPVTAILGQADVALRRDRTAEEYREVLSRVQRQAQHLHKMIEALLFLARADVDAPPPELEKIELASWLQEYVSEKATTGRWTNLQLVLEDESAVVAAHPSLLSELLDILVDNAVKYGGIGSSPVLRMQPTSGQIALSVEDQGVGIEPRDLPHIFEPFYRSANAQVHKIGGLGLGLSIARRLARSFGAELEAASRFGFGATFTIRFPRQEASRAARVGVSIDGEIGNATSRPEALAVDSALRLNGAKPR